MTTRITQLRNAAAMLESARLELNRFKPNFDRAYEFAERAFDLIGLMRIEQAAADRLKGANHGERT